MPLVQSAGREIRFESIDLVPPWVASPQAIVLHHGLGSNRHCWTPWLPELVDRFRVVRFDMPGHGDSPAPAGEDYPLQSMVDDLLAVADAAGVERFHLVGESIGATVALALAAGDRDRVLSLTVSNGAHVGGSVRNVQSWARVIDEQGMAGWSAGMMSSRFGDGELPDDMRRWFERCQTACDPRVLLAALRALLDTDLAERVGGIGVPTLILHPDSSPFIPVETMADLHRRIAGSRLQVFPGCRHGLPFARGRECAAALRRFLDAHF